MNQTLWTTGQADTSGSSDDTRQQRPWSGRTRGGWFGNWFFITVVRAMGLRLAYLCLVPVSAYFLFAAPRARRASMQYLMRVGKARPRGLASFWHCYRHFFTYGKVLLDRVVALGSRHHGLRFEFDGEEHLRRAVAEGRGLILLSAHIGSWEVASRAFEGWPMRVNVVAFQGETQRIRRLLNRSFTEKQFNLIEIDGSPASVIQIHEALSRGEIVAMHGDRRFRERGQPCRLLGGEAHLPTGPFIAAAVCRAPMIQTFITRRGYRRYRLKAHPAETLAFADRDHREVQLRQWVQRFADRIEQQVRQTPYQWFNFFDIWNDPGDQPHAAASDQQE